MNGFGIFRDKDLIMVCGTKEKAEDMLKNYPNCKVFEVVEVNRRWIKK